MKFAIESLCLLSTLLRSTLLAGFLDNWTPCSTFSRSWCSVMPIFAYVMLPAMCFSWCCAYYQCPSVNYIICFVMLVIYQIAIFIRFYLWYLWLRSSSSSRWPCEAEACRRLIENKKWMCYDDGQKNKYSVLNECNRMLKYNMLINIYSEDTCSVFNCHNVAKRTVSYLG
jgi:hypothetical protein